LRSGTGLRLEGGEPGDGIIHFSVPARHWWDNFKFTLKTMLIA